MLFAKGNKINLGRFPSEKTRKKLSEATKQGWATGKRKGTKGVGLGRKLGEATKRKISESKKGKIVSEATRKKLSLINRGSKIWTWKGGITKNKVYRSWNKNKRNRAKRRLNKNGSFHTFGEWELLKKQYNFICPCCKKSEPEINLTEDHIIPLSKGGGDNIENIQPLCKSCNCKKHTRTIKYLII